MIRQINKIVSKLINYGTSSRQVEIQNPTSVSEEINKLETGPRKPSFWLSRWTISGLCLAW